MCSVVGMKVRRERAPYTHDVLIAGCGDPFGVLGGAGSGAEEAAVNRSAAAKSN